MAENSVAQADPMIGSMLGKDYLVLERIGIGGMAVVYLVEHQTLQKRFAAKVLSSEHASSAEARARFTAEAHAASQLDHENIVTISDFGITPDNRPYFVMELLRGKTLADRIEEGPMSIEEVVAVCVPVARALAYAHAEGIIHRDVKPENIFLVQRSQGRWGVKVLDFGIAKIPVNDRMTKTGQALGSPMYMAPEACRGDDVDQRADIYSFGIVLYLMLAGRVPFADENLLKVLQMQVIAPLPLPSSFNPDLPAELEIVIIRALAKDPADRYETMEEFLYAFEAALPDGADALLIQAQFGTSTTPFPGTLERVRNSARISKVPYSVTGEHELGEPTAVPKTVPPKATRPASLPQAPGKGRRVGLVLGTLLVLGAAGAGVYMWTQRSSNDDPNVASAAPPVPTLPAPVATKAAPPPAAAAVAVTVPAAATPPVETATADSPDHDAPPVTDVVETTASPKATTKKAATRAAPARATSRVAASVTDKASPKTGSGSPAPSSGSAATTPAVVATTAPPPVETPAPPPPPPTPAVTPATMPTTPPPPAVVKPAPAAVVTTGSMDANPVIASLDVNGPLPGSVVRRAVERVLPAVRACYRAAATAQKKTPALTMTVRLEIDENSSATNVSAGNVSFGSLASCAKNAVGQVQTQQAPDVGTAEVALTIKFTPL